MTALMEADVTALAGPKGKHNRERVAVRHGTDRGSVTLGGRRVPVERPRVRAADGSGELPVPSYELLNSTEVLGRLAMEKMLAGLSSRRYGQVGLEPVGEQVTVTSKSTSTSKSAVSRKLGADRDRAGRPAGRRPVPAGPGRIDDRRSALRPDVLRRRARHRPAGHQASLALVEGATENATLVTELLVVPCRAACRREPTPALVTTSNLPMAVTSTTHDESHKQHHEALNTF